MKKHLLCILLLVSAIVLLDSASTCYAKTKKKTIYVVSKADEKEYYEGDETRHKRSYSYTSDGKISKITERSSQVDGTSTWKYKYKGEKYIACKHYQGKEFVEYNQYDYDSNGRVSTLSVIVPDYPDYDLYFNFTYDKSGHCIKMDINGENTIPSTTKSKYYKNGLLKKYGNKTFKYDKHKMIKQIKGKGYGTKKFINTYKKGLLVKTRSKKKYDRIVKYSYKKIKVPVNKLPFIKAQQRWIFRNNLVWLIEELESIYR